jgi:hypothetical protein
MQSPKKLIMVLKWAAICVSAPAVNAAAQTAVTTPDGTVNVVPLFTDSSTVGNSAITQSNGDVAVGTLGYAQLSNLGIESFLLATGRTNGGMYVTSSQPSPCGYQIGYGNITMTGEGTITFPDGTVQSTAFTGFVCGGDYAEFVNVTGNRTSYVPDDLLVVDPDTPGRFLKSTEAYSTLVAGIYSTKPGAVSRRQAAAKSPGEVPMALVSIVPANVSAENGPIKTGDLLVSSSTVGYAMMGTGRQRLIGAVTGKALGPFDSGTGHIEVLFTLQ